MMVLNGWKYTGRIINDAFHEQIKCILDLLDDSQFIGNETWPAVQKKIALELGVAAGQIRTLKKMMEEFDLVKMGCLNQRDVVDYNSLITENGIILKRIMEVERGIQQKSSSEKDRLQHQVDKMKKNFYSRIILKYIMPYGGRGESSGNLHPLRAVLIALREYQSLDFFEWYLLNTFIEKDSDTNDLSFLTKQIEAYREGELKIEKKDIVQYKLSHSYVAGILEYGGFIKISRRPFKIIENPLYKEVNDSIVDKEFLIDLYKER